MHITLSSVLNTCVLGSLLILMLSPILKRNAVINRIGPGCVKLLLLLMAIRMFFPVELKITHSLYVQKLLPSVHDFFRCPIGYGSVTFPLYGILLLLWGAGSLISITEKVLLYYRTYRYIQLMDAQNVEELCIEQGLTERYPDMEQIRIVYITGIQSPCLLGLYHPFVLLPADQIYSQEQLSFILKHELMHYRKKDILWKVVADVLCSIFWWNPAISSLRRLLFQMIEVSNDMEITASMEKEEKISYLKCLKDIAAGHTGKNQAFAVSFSRNNFKDLKQRMVLIAKGVSYRPGIAALVSSVSISLMLMISLVNFEPDTPPPDGIPLCTENTYLIRNGEQYDVYVNGEGFLFTTDDTAPFRGVKIYDNIEEAKSNEKE